MGTAVGSPPTPFLSLLCQARSLSPGESSPLVGLVSPLGDEELYLESFPGNTPPASSGRGECGFRDKPVAAGHTPPLLLPPTRSGSQPRPGPRGAAAAAPAPLSPRTFGPLRERV